MTNLCSTNIKKVLNLPHNVSEEKDTFAEPSTPRKIERVRIYGLPKGAVMWPTAVTAIVIGLIGLIAEIETLAFVFFIVFGFNLMVLFFDFSRGVVFGIFGLIVALIAVLYGVDFEFAPVRDVVDQSIVGGASPAFLLTYGLLFMILYFIAVRFRRSFEYFELSSNEMVKKQGILGDAERFNAPDLQIKKEIGDVFESLILFGAGNLRITTAKGREFYIENVPRINRVEEDIRRLLGTLEVDTG